jgi:hypothetical protein
MTPLSIKFQETKDFLIAPFDNAIKFEKLTCNNNLNDEVYSIKLNCKDKVIDYKRGKWLNKLVFYPNGIIDNEAILKFTPMEKIDINFEITFKDDVPKEIKETILKNFNIQINLESCKADK